METKKFIQILHKSVIMQHATTWLFGLKSLLFYHVVLGIMTHIGLTDNKREAARDDRRPPIMIFGVSLFSHFLCNAIYLTTVDHSPSTIPHSFQYYFLLIITIRFATVLQCQQQNIITKTWEAKSMMFS